MCALLPSNRKCQVHGQGTRYKAQGWYLLRYLQCLNLCLPSACCNCTHHCSPVHAAHPGWGQLEGYLLGTCCKGRLAVIRAVPARYRPPSIQSTWHAHPSTVEHCSFIPLHLWFLFFLQPCEEDSRSRQYSLPHLLPLTKGPSFLALRSHRKSLQDGKGGSLSTHYRCRWPVAQCSGPRGARKRLPPASRLPTCLSLFLLSLLARSLPLRPGHQSSQQSDPRVSLHRRVTEMTDRHWMVGRRLHDPRPASLLPSVWLGEMRFLILSFPHSQPLSIRRASTGQPRFGDPEEASGGPGKQQAKRKLSLVELHYARPDCG